MKLKLFVLYFFFIFFKVYADECKNFEEKVSFYSLPEDRADILEHAIAIFIEIIGFFPNSFLFDSSWNIADAVIEKELQENKNIQAA